MYVILIGRSHWYVNERQMLSQNIFKFVNQINTYQKKKTILIST